MASFITKIHYHSYDLEKLIYVFGIGTKIRELN